MAANESYTITSHNMLNYSGMLFNKGNIRVPFSTMIGARQKIAKAFEFTTSLSYTTQGGVSQPLLPHRTVSSEHVHRQRTSVRFSVLQSGSLMPVSRTSVRLQG
jgi:hypothetical protein